MSAYTETTTGKTAMIACVIPSYKVTAHVLSVIDKIGPEVGLIYVVDDKCPDNSGEFVQQHCQDPRVKVLFNPVNMGVGGAVMTGYQQAMLDGADVIVKIDGDDQMDPRLLPAFVAPILAGEADYVKGNRFFDPEAIGTMPPVRVFGNACLSFMAKLSTGYWHLFDPTNGYTAIHARVAELLPLKKISNRYFFETDILFRLNCVGAVVADLPMVSTYGDEVSNLKISRVIPDFLGKHIRNISKRLVYKYLIRDFSVASLELMAGLALLLFGIVYGTIRWTESAYQGIPATAGAVMLAALPVLAGLQLLLAFLGYDMFSVPRRPIHPAMNVRKRMQDSLRLTKPAQTTADTPQAES